MKCFFHLDEIIFIFLVSSIFITLVNVLSLVSVHRKCDSIFVLRVLANLVDSLIFSCDFFFFLFFVALDNHTQLNEITCLPIMINV